MKKLITKIGVLACLLMAGQTWAQTDLQCRTGINSSAGINCEFQLTAAELLASSPSSQTAYEISIGQYSALDTLVLGPDFLNQTVEFKVTDTTTGVFCWGYILFEDGLIPLPECGADTVDCTDDISPDSLGLPVPDSVLMNVVYFGNNCYTVTGWDLCSTIDLCFEDVSRQLECDPDFCSVIYRTWTVTDPNISPNKPNSASCVDTIYISLPLQSGITGPMDFLKPNDQISCGDLNYNGISDRTEDIWPPVSVSNPTLGNGKTDIEEDQLQGVAIETTSEVLAGYTKPWIPLPDVTGSPLGLECDDCILSHWKDHIIEGECSRFVERTWKIVAWCANQDLDTTFVQKIKIVDDEAPRITSCPSGVTLYVGAHSCTSSDALPKPTAIDDCDDHLFKDGVNLSVYTDKGNIVKSGSEYYLELDLSVYSAPDEHYAEALITWVIDDGCNNKDTCQYVARVVDNSPPEAACISNIQVSVSPSDGFAKLFANQSFDAGSHDNCQPHVYFKVIRVDDEDVDNPKHGSSGISADQFPCDGLNGDDDLAEDGYGNQLGFEVYYDDYVKFCCEDIGTEVKVLLRVYDWLPPGYHDGPVPRSFHEQGGILAGRFNDCWTTVLVEDKFGILTCPQDLEILCTEHLPPSEATANTACNVNDVVLLGEDDDRNSCGLGYVTRSWRTTFPNGSYQECDQRIRVVDTDENYYIVDTECPIYDGTNVDDEDGVTWPCDVALDCLDNMDDLSPDSLESKPTIFDQIGECSSVFVGSDDLVLTQDDESCVKVIRTWTIIDWCGDIVTANNPQDAPGCSAYGSKPRWCYEQIIKVVDNEKPVLTINMEMKCDSLEGCNAYTKLYVEADDNCTGLNENRTTWKIYLDEDLDMDPISGNGTLFSGFLPAGDHTVEFEGEDACGNHGIASKDFNVVECKQPVPICNVGIGTVIMPSNGEVTIWAVEVDGGTKDDCSDITFGIRRDGETLFTDSIVLKCADLGGNPTASVKVDMQVTDEDGNSDFCSTFINLQDNEDVCGNGGPIVSGTITTRSGIPTSNHPVQLLNINEEIMHESITDANGGYGFYTMEGVRYIRPIKNDDAVNGVNTLDLLAIQRHLLSINVFDSPFSLIASDANNDGMIDVLDLLNIQRVILGLSTEFENNRSWRYVPTTEEMDMESAFTFEEPKDVGQMSLEEMMDVNFTAVKIGDINNSAQAEGITGSEVSSRTSLDFVADASKVEYGATIRIPVTSTNFTNVDGYQYTLSYDANKLEFIEIESGALQISENNIMSSLSLEGLVTTNWYETQAQTYAADEVLFTLVLRGESLESLTMNSALTYAESYRDGSIGSVSFDIQSRSGNESFTLYQNTPNPFYDRTLIGFDLPSDSEATLHVFDVSGREIYRSSFAGTEGYNEQAISKEHLSGSAGIFYYQVETQDYSATKKMVAF